MRLSANNRCTAIEYAESVYYDSSSTISGYYPDMTPQPGASRYGKTAPRRVEFVADYYLAVCNSPLPED